MNDDNDNRRAYHDDVDDADYGRVPDSYNCVKLFRLELLQVYIDAAQNGRQLAYTITCISASTLMLHMGSKSQFNTRGDSVGLYSVIRLASHLK